MTESKMVAVMFKALQDYPPARQVGIVLGVLAMTLEKAEDDPQALKIYFDAVEQMVKMTELHKKAIG